MTATLLDHFLMLALIAILPIEGVMEIRSLALSLRCGVPDARGRALIRTIGTQWLLAGGLLAGWAAAARPWGALGLSFSTATLDVAAGATGVALTLALVVAQFRGIKRLTPERRAKVASRNAEAFNLLPVTRGERVLFGATAITAGICEELLFRGFLFWYVAQYLPASLVFVVASTLFGLGHAYQGRKGVIRTAIAGVFLGGLYVLSGSLWWPIVAHAAIDLGVLFVAPMLVRPQEPVGCPMVGQIAPS